MIKLNDVTFNYGSTKQVLSGIDLIIEAGHIYGLLGKNGEGKTTLLKLLSGLVFPNKGSIQVLNENPSERKASFLQQVFILPEEMTYPDVRIVDYINMYRPFYPSFSNERLKICLESFEINDSDKLKKMSMGQKKKVAITFALSVNTPLLLLDEPTNGLDIPSKSIFRKLIASFTDENQTVIISTHQVRDLESLIDTVIILDQKEILLNNTLEEISNLLAFRLLQPDEEALYSEPSPSGIIGVTENNMHLKTPVSLELLFNAATIRKNEIKRIFR